MAWIKIILICIAASIGYGICHDQVTIRICEEYFTIGHPHIINTDSLTVLALCWGIIATWWMGLLIGIPLSFAALVGKRPKRSTTSLVVPILWLLIFMALFSVLAGLTGFYLARAQVVVLLDPIASSVPTVKHVAYITNLWAHSASYVVGVIGGISLIITVWRSRLKGHVQNA